jgi:hypothetical protein
MIKGGRLGSLVNRIPKSTRSRLWRASVRVQQAIRRPSAGWRLLPDYLIAGGQRCGTTSLQKYLIQHPDVVPPGVLKGIHYFDTNYDKGLAWYQSHFPLERTRNRRADNGGMVLTGEASPYYMFHPDIPRRIAAEVPGARIIVLVRDPVDRAYSHYLHEVRRGFEDESFERALDLEETRLAGEAARLRQDPEYISFEHQHHSYVARGRYIDQLENMTKHIPKEQIFVISSEEMFRDPAATYQGVLDFLGLAPFLPDGFAAQNANVYKDPIDPAVRTRLEELFAEPNGRLEAFVGRSFGWGS